MEQLNVTRVLGENLDAQFSHYGEPLVDLISRGAQALLERGRNSKSADVHSFVNLVRNAFNKDRKLTIKVMRFYRDKAEGQALKEQSLLAIAALADQLTEEEICSILTVNSVSGEGNINHPALEDMVKVLCWHQILFGNKTKFPKILIRAFGKLVAAYGDERLMSTVYSSRNRRLPADIASKHHLGVVDLLGLLRKQLTGDIANEYDNYLLPYYRKRRSARPFTEYGQALARYFKNKGNPDGSVPKGVSLTKALSIGDKKGVATLVKEGRLSPYQFKVNMSTIFDLCGADVAMNYIATHDVSLMPHEVFAMGKAFMKGTQYTKADPNKLKLVDVILQKLVDKYAREMSDDVLVLGDTSGSMSFPLSGNSSIVASEFSGFMSYFAAHIMRAKNGNAVFGTWDSTARLYSVNDKPTMLDFFNVHLGSDMSTNLYGSIVEVADYCKKAKMKHPKTLCFISDMQFDYVTDSSSYSYSSYSYAVRVGKKKSGAVEAALEYYKSVAGFEPQMIYWNVNASTTPSIQKKNIMLISGFSAKLVDIVLGIADDKQVKEKKLKPTDILKWIDEHYQ